MTSGAAEAVTERPFVVDEAGEKGGLGARLPALSKPLCGALLRYTGEPCARSAGHAGGKGGAHRSRYVMDNDARMRRGKWAAR